MLVEIDCETCCQAEGIFFCLFLLLCEGLLNVVVLTAVLQLYNLVLVTGLCCLLFYLLQF